MNAKLRVASLFLFIAMLGAMPMLANASTTVITHWAPGTVTAVHTYGPYWGVQPVACCSYGAVAAGVAAGVVTGAAIASASAPRPAVVYTPPPVVTLPVIYVTPPPPHYYYVP